MKKFIVLFSIIALFLCSVGLTRAQELEATEVEEATLAATQEATPSVGFVEVVLPKEDITQPTEEVKGKLVRYLEENPVEPLTFTNFLQHGLRSAVKNGIPANTIVLLLMFPLMAAIIAASRHLFGLRGFGIFVPAVLSVAFVATGILVGIVVFLTILIVAGLARKMLRKLKLQYLPRMALLLWAVAMGVLGIVFIAPIINLGSLTNISIFPILILVLLAENFIEAQLGMSKKEATEMTFQTIMIALVCSLLLSWESLQKFVILNPELVVSFTAVFNIFVGKYTGLRFLERWKFKELLK